MNKKEQARLRRAKKARAHIEKLGKTRLSISRSNKHISATITTPSGDKVLVTASTKEKDIRKQNKVGCNKESATNIGKLVATRALQAGIEEVACDRSGYKYHGKVKSLVEAARETGLKI